MSGCGGGEEEEDTERELFCCLLSLSLSLSLTLSLPPCPVMTSKCSASLCATPAAARAGGRQLATEPHDSSCSHRGKGDGEKERSGRRWRQEPHSTSTPANEREIAVVGRVVAAKRSSAIAPSPQQVLCDGDGRNDDVCREERHAGRRGLNLKNIRAAIKAIGCPLHRSAAHLLNDCLAVQPSTTI